MRIDLNCDMGEGIGDDEELFPRITSANIACGFHAGDPTIMRASVRAAVKHGVAIGAHPGLPDRENFGRIARPVTPDEAYGMVLYQIGALQAIARAEKGEVVHVKPHGALYNMAAVDAELADGIARAVVAADRRMVLVGLSGSELIRAGERAGLPTGSEVFADRAYLSDGTLAPRDQPGAMITDIDAVVHQSVRLAVEQRVKTLDGKDLIVRAETICVHGDGPDALQFVKAIRKALKAAGVVIIGLRRHIQPWR